MLIQALIMLTATGVLIAFGDFILRHVPDTLNNNPSKLSEGGNTQAAPDFDQGRGMVKPSAAVTRTDKGDTAHRDWGL